MSVYRARRGKRRRCKEHPKNRLHRMARTTIGRTTWPDEMVGTPEQLVSEIMRDWVLDQRRAQERGACPTPIARIIDRAIDDALLCRDFLRIPF